MILCQTKPQTSLGSKCGFFLPSAFLLNLSIFFFSFRLCYEEGSFLRKPETDEMNEVETAPVTEAKHDWVQPRVIRPKKTSTVSYMSESGSSLPPCPLEPPLKGGHFLQSGWGGGRGAGGLRGLQVLKQQEQGGLQLATVEL